MKGAGRDNSESFLLFYPISRSSFFRRDPNDSTGDPVVRDGIRRQPLDIFVCLEQTYPPLARPEVCRRFLRTSFWALPLFRPGARSDLIRTRRITGGRPRLWISFPCEFLESRVQVSSHLGLIGAIRETYGTLSVNRFANIY